MVQLSPSAQGLLNALVSHIQTGTVAPSDPSTFIGYKELHDELGLELLGRKYGESLQVQGLNDLAEWTKQNSLPSVTGMIISRSTLLPGDGYFNFFRGEEDFSWWQSEIQKSIELDWTPYLSSAVVSDTDSTSSVNSAEERQHRINLWNQLPGNTPVRRTEPGLLRELGIYGGAQGIWVDKKRTEKFSNDGAGISMGLLHTGSSYADDISEECVIYHYPSTNRPTSRDLSEIDATKNAKKLNVPVFVITYPSPSSKFRDVHLGWVEDWDDDAKVFLIAFGEEAPVADDVEIENTPFSPKEQTPIKFGQTQQRPGQQKFRFKVMKRYGVKCVFCEVSRPELVDAAHLIAKRDSGSDDPRNGLPICALHHRAVDARLLLIDPVTLEFCIKDNGPTLDELKVTKSSLSGAQMLPHADALQWLWEHSQ